MLLESSLNPSADSPNSENSAPILPRDRTELCKASAFLFDPIREVFTKKDHCLTQLPVELAVLRSCFQRQMIHKEDWTRPLSTDFSFRRGLSSQDLAKFAASIMEKDSTHFDEQCCTDFRTRRNGRPGPASERLLRLSEDIIACATADAELVEPICNVLIVRFNPRQYSYH